MTGYIQKPHDPALPVFGSVHSLGGTPVNPGGHWLGSIPTQDVQQNTGIEAEDCTSQGTIAALETLANFLYKDTTAWSKRYLAWASNTTPQGNDPMTVLQTLKAKGTVPHALWPQTADLTTWDALYATPPQALQTKALEYLAQYGVDGEWVTTDPASLMAALEYSPLGVAGWAWTLDDATGLYVSPAGALPDHWFAVVDYVQNEYWTVFDSYAQDLKHLAWDYPFAEAMRYSLVSNVPNTVTARGWFQQFLALMKSILGV